MDQEELRQTVAKGESESLELKKTTGDLKAGMKTLSAMLNGAGGRVLYGVTPGGKIAGQDITDPTLQEVAQEIRRLEPPAHIEQIRVPVSGGKEILILQTTTAPDAPYTYDGRPYRRIGPTTSQMPQSQCYHPPLRVSQDLTERQRRLLLILSHSQELTFPDIYDALEEPPSERTVRTELRVLSGLGLVGSRGRGKFARWWLKMPEK